MRAHMQALLQMESVKDTEFELEVLACLPATPWSISEAEISMRRDLRSSRCSLPGPAFESGPCSPTLCECMALAFWLPRLRMPPRQQLPSQGLRRAPSAMAAAPAPSASSCWLHSIGLQIMHALHCQDSHCKIPV